MRSLRRLARLLAREGVGSWVSVALVVLVLGLLHQFGTFRIVDGQLFDLATTQASGTAPSVVIVERDRQFERLGRHGVTKLENELAKLEVERIGYLGLRQSVSAPALAGRIVVGMGPEAVPASETWQIPMVSQRPGQTAAARIMMPAEYGIYRRQVMAIPGKGGALASFEAAVAGAGPRVGDIFYIPMPARQSLPVITASQVIEQQFAPGALARTVVIVAGQEALQGTLTTPISPDARRTSEAQFRGFAIQALRNGTAVRLAQSWQAWLILAALGAIMGIAYHRSDPKRLALAFPLAVSILTLVLGWTALTFAMRLLPLSAMFLLPWVVTFLRILGREQAQDRRLEITAARAVQHAFGRSMLREGARLPEFLANAARLAAVEHSLVIERKGERAIAYLHPLNADPGDITLPPKELAQLLDRLRERHATVDANHVVAGWTGQVRLTWLGGTGRDLYWLYTFPRTGDRRKSAMLVRAITASFRELFSWRANLNARQDLDHRLTPIDDKVASAISLVSNSSEQISHGFDTIGTAVMIFHMVGSPIHANAPMRDIYRQAGLTVTDASLTDALLRLTEIDLPRIDAMLQDLLIHGGEMRVPMRQLGPEERIFRIAAPKRIARARERVIVLEAIDVSELHRAADLRQAVALFMDLQLRNDFEAIMLGADLAADPRITPDKVRPIVSRIADTTRRAIGRLDQVADLVRRDISNLEHACYPVDAAAIVSEAVERTAEFATELSVEVETELPGASGFTVAEPVALGAMLRAMLRVLIADTPQGDMVKLKLEELEGRTYIRISGGFGIALERLLQLLSNHESEAAGDYRTIAEGMALAMQWDASVSYWGREADGFGFNVNLKRIG
ncbi:hypothetical protein LY632_02665 [Erythrobacter sp. SDW2]|uniref:hypothetical protein n=1 Tax=Erythrobacter sp. SDW2 TaxID=2907154 RepID=UPI001F2C50E0|nr:hypothetical protein [Erythrobacter sp. SDW2]UIP07321.1 hypothetical protein LY632_02665 [Erythrobacter sp. SDW2]